MADSGSAPPELVFYPRYCFHLSPTIGRWCHLRAADIAALTFNPGFEGQDIYFYLNHPIKWARIAGVVVAIQEFAHRIIYTIDDSSGATIECVVATAPQFPAVTNYKNPTDPNTSTDGKPLPKTDGPIDVGHIIDIKGVISVFRSVKQIRAEKVAHLRTTEQEAVFWEKIALLRKEVLCRPWVLDPSEVRKLRREEEGMVKKQRRTGLERVSKRRKSDEGRVKNDGRDRLRPSSRTGLERERAQSGGVVVAEVAKDDRHSHRHRTGLERRATTRAVVQEEEPDNPDRRHRKTGLEPQRRRGGDHDRSLATRSRQPLERPELDETMSSSHARLRSGLEKWSVRSRAQESVPSNHQSRQTGLEPPSFLETADDTTPSTSRLTGLERRRSSRRIELGPSNTAQGPKTGLERTSSSRRQDAAGDAWTGLERATSQRAEGDGHKTGLERRSSRDQEKQPSARHRSTGLEPRKQSQQSSDPSQPRITGLERQSSKRPLMEKSSQNSQSDQQLQEERCEPKTTILRPSSIKRPDSQVLVRGKGRLTGLERVTKPITRSPPVTGKYDAPGL
ncbi:hypothetical protein QBC36DRAFT_36902 [Triangularia setosa]|uniref:CST complex subunit Stn1 N-terminal domain-containing protein n=1 Tax=Triangularia setosa TaxID=2587417 RepID=A0AAN7A9G5_9PEZI|nr:hypothetical protein QBC36DRAFT_36902 [Podospora setosa]